MNRNNGRFSILFCRPPANPAMPPAWYPVAEGASPEEAMDRAIAKFEAKEKRQRKK